MDVVVLVAEEEVADLTKGSKLMNQDSQVKRVLVRDIRRKTREELAWERKNQKKARAFRIYLILGMVAALVFAASIVLGLIYGRR